MKATKIPAAIALAIVGTMLLAPPATAVSYNPAGDVAKVYSPITDCDRYHGDVSSWWSNYNPDNHHRVYAYYNPETKKSHKADISMDVYARAAGKCVVTPFGTKTAAGDVVISKVSKIANGCASGRYEDGGKVVFVDAYNGRTGRLIARGSIMHIAKVQVRVGQRLGPWTTIGKTAQFRRNPCYEVRTARGIHTHLEWMNIRRYACNVKHPDGAPLKETTPLGKIATNKTGIRARC